jgi:curli biogenesis system outer membrane secretion channel CsgG
MAGNAQGETVQLPKCSAPLGTVALVEDQDPALAQHGLSSPIPVLRLMIAQSGCFNVVDRGQALTRIQQEQQLTGTAAGKRNLVAAQYFLTPNIVFKDKGTGGGGLGLGGLLPGYVGLVAGAVGYEDSQAQTVLFLTQTDTGLQVAVAEGAAATKDWNLLGIGFGGGLGGVGGGYSDTPLGKTVTAALVDAYGKLVRQLQTQGG